MKRNNKTPFSQVTDFIPIAASCTQINLSWHASTANFKSLTNYNYTVAAIDSAYNESIKSAIRVTNAAGFPRIAAISTTILSTLGGTTTDGKTANYRTSLTVTATAKSGYTFVNWTENGTPASTSISYTFTANRNRSLAADFSAVSSGGSITNNLVGCWAFDTTTVKGMTAIDSSGTGNNGTLMGTVLPAIMPGKIAQAVNLDGVSGHVNVSDSAKPSITSQLNVSAWVNFSSLLAFGKYLNAVAELNSPSACYGYGLFWYGGVAGIIGSGAPSWNIISAAPGPGIVFARNRATRTEKPTHDRKI